MRTFKADLHIHTLLSPCGSLDMSPKGIVHTALEKGIDIIAITDHNSTRQCRTVMQEAENKPLSVLAGVEITTREEVHCLAIFETIEVAEIFQNYIDSYMQKIENDVKRFGYQVVVDIDENIVYEEKLSLLSSISQTIDDVSAQVHTLGGLFIPAHIDKSKNSLISQLGFIPKDLQADAFELSKHVKINDYCKKQQELVNQTILQNSDAHYLDDIGSVYNLLLMKAPTFDEVKLAIAMQEGRKVIYSEL